MTLSRILFLIFAWRAWYFACAVSWIYIADSPPSHAVWNISTLNAKAVRYNMSVCGFVFNACFDLEFDFWLHETINIQSLQCVWFRPRVCTWSFRARAVIWAWNSYDFLPFWVGIISVTHRCLSSLDVGLLHVVRSNSLIFCLIAPGLCAHGAL